MSHNSYLFQYISVCCLLQSSFNIHLRYSFRVYGKGNHVPKQLNETQNCNNSMVSALCLSPIRLEQFYICVIKSSCHFGMFMSNQCFRLCFFFLLLQTQTAMQKYFRLLFQAIYIVIIKENKNSRNDNLFALIFLFFSFLHSCNGHFICLFYLSVSI